ncbi:hypothetical protein KSP39_PZI006515 [Platanthera zijinensis]|uniref:Uncharacterized protein n=1 Tax=Platanthera zijinensis TaxID=2320716 RepID=A0AAP0BQS3_9ASPA
MRRLQSRWGPHICDFLLALDAVGSRTQEKIHSGTVFVTCMYDGPCKNLGPPVTPPTTRKNCSKHFPRLQQSTDTCHYSDTAPDLIPFFLHATLFAFSFHLRPYSSPYRRTWEGISRRPKLLAAGPSHRSQEVRSSSPFRANRHISPIFSSDARSTVSGSDPTVSHRRSLVFSSPVHASGFILLFYGSISLNLNVFRCCSEQQAAGNMVAAASRCLGRAVGKAVASPAAALQYETAACCCFPIVESTSRSPLSSQHQEIAGKAVAQIHAKRSLAC